MSNIRKSFNFRNGVQVDEDNFIINSNGLVGIGTSIPTEALDVRGTAKVVGLATVDNLYAKNGTVGVLTITKLNGGGFICGYWNYYIIFTCWCCNILWRWWKIIKPTNITVD